MGNGWPLLYGVVAWAFASVYVRQKYCSSWARCSKEDSIDNDRDGQTNSPFTWIPHKQLNQGIDLNRPLCLATCGSVWQPDLAPSRFGLVGSLQTHKRPEKQSGLASCYILRTGFSTCCGSMDLDGLICKKKNMEQENKAYNHSRKHRPKSTPKPWTMDVSVEAFRPMCVIVRAPLWQAVCNNTDILTIWSPCHANSETCESHGSFGRVEAGTKGSKAGYANRCVRGRRMRRRCKCISFGKVFVIWYYTDFDLKK